MNIIRTTAVELSSIPAIAYKQKLASGGAGLRILRLDRDVAGIFTIDRRTGGAIPYKNVDETLFPDYAVDEALELMSSLPFSSRGKIKVSVFEEVKEEEDVTEEETDAVDMVDSDEYNALIERYSNESGKLNYKLMNKDFIQFASKSKMVTDMTANNTPEDDIVVHILRSRAAHLANKKDSLSIDETKALIESLEEIDPRGAFKDLKNHLRRMSTRK